MSKNLIIALIVSGSVALIAVIIAISAGSMYFGYNREEVRLRTTIEAKLKDNQNVHSSVWKIIKFHAKVPDRERDKAIALFNGWASGRTADGQGRMMAWIKETAPTIDNSLYKTMMVKIEANLKEFQSAQTQLTHLSSQHNALIQDPWKSMFLKVSDPIDVTIVVASDTKQAFETGIDDAEVPFGDEDDG